MLYGLFFFAVMSLPVLFNQQKAVCTDSRQIIPGSIFFALKGDNFNGNAFALQAIDKGCAYAVVDEDIGSDNPRIIRVPDVLKALQDLGRSYRQQLNIPVIGITGSNGKTTTKELIAAVLGNESKCRATKGNLNNHIGVPLTLLSIQPDDHYAIVEMGANHPGEIAFLCEMAQPDIGIITNIGSAHLEGFGDLEGVLNTKRALYDSVIGNEGVLFVNAADRKLMSLSEGAHRFCYGINTDSRIVCNNYTSSPYLSLSWTDTERNESYRVQTRLFGSFNLNNVLAAVAVGVHFNTSPEHINLALAGYQPQNNRSQVLNIGDNIIIMDAYNANPASMKLVIEEMNAIEHPNKILILGDMFELGKSALKAHQKVAVQAIDTGCRCLFAGSVFSSLTLDNGLQFVSAKDCCQYLRSHPIHDSLILVKGSRGMAMEQILGAFPA